VASPSCSYPQSDLIRRTVREELRAVAEDKDKCTSFYLETLESQSNPCLAGDVICAEGKDHHQGLTRTHQLSDGSIYFFLSHSETDSGDRVHLMQFRYSGQTEGEHIGQAFQRAHLVQTRRYRICEHGYALRREIRKTALLFFVSMVER